MKYLRWVWILPLTLLVLALASHVYGPHAYRLQAQRDRAINNTGYLFQHNPEVVERLSRAINFPALVLSYPFRNEDNAVYRRNTEYTLVWIAPKDIAFFACIVVFWCLVGRAIDKRRGGLPRETWPRKIRIAGLSCGVILGILTGAYAAKLVTSEWLPERQIAGFGIAWSIVLLAYFIWRLTSEFSGSTRPTSSR